MIRQMKFRKRINDRNSSDSDSNIVKTPLNGSSKCVTFVVVFHRMYPVPNSSMTICGETLVPYTVTMEIKKKNYSYQVLTGGGFIN